MRITLSTPRRPGHARATRRPRSSRIGAVDGVILAMANPTAAARKGNQITNPMVDVMVGVQAAAEAANNANTGDNSSPRRGCGHHETRNSHLRPESYTRDKNQLFDKSLFSVNTR